MLHSVKKLDYLCNCVMEGHCIQARKVMHHNANGCFEWLIFGQQSVNPWREPTSILSGKYKRFTFVHPVPGDPKKYSGMRKYQTLAFSFIA